MEAQFNVFILFFTLFVSALSWDEGFRKQREERRKMKLLKEKFSQY